MIRSRNESELLIISYIIFCFLITHLVSPCRSKSFINSVELSKNGELLRSRREINHETSSSSERLRRFNETESYGYKTHHRKKEEEGQDSSSSIYETEINNSRENEFGLSREEDDTMEKAEAFPELVVATKAIGARLSKKWKSAFHTARKAIFGAPKYIAVRYHQRFGKLLGLSKMGKKKKQKKKKHHHHDSEED